MTEANLQYHQSTTMDGPRDVNTTRSKLWGDSNALQPAELLNKNVKIGKFSMQNVLSTSDSDELDDDTPEIECATLIADGQNPDDPTHCKILNFPIALGLFNSFMRSMNPFVSQFDPQLHTFEYVQQRSPFLLTSILAAAARAFHPPLHSRLRAHSEALLATSFTQGVKSTEMIQGILVSTYWKEPDDTRSWLLVGYAIRMAIELGWHKFTSARAGSPEGETGTEIRELRNAKRTWLILFVYDRRYMSILPQCSMWCTDSILHSASVCRLGNLV